MLKEKSIGGVIFIEENKKRLYLLLEYKRINEKLSPHIYWDFPKGHIENNETEKETLFREIKEETSISKLNLIQGFKKEIKYFFKKDNKLISKEVVYYLMESNSKEVKISEEHSDFAWLNYEKAIEKIGFKTAKGILKEAEKFLNNSLINY